MNFKWMKRLFVFLHISAYYNHSFAKRTHSHLACEMPSAANNELNFIIHELKLRIWKIKFIWEFLSFGSENVASVLSLFLSFRTF